MLFDSDFKDEDKTSVHDDGDSDIERLQQELNDAISKAEENLSGWKRTQADFENYRKRKEGESAELVSFGKQRAFMQILPVLDSLEQALLHAPDVQDEKYNNWKLGLFEIARQINDALSQMGIKKIEALGKQFDPYLHEAVKEVPGEENGLVAEQYQTGFTLDGNVIRPAQVAITKKVAD